MPATAPCLRHPPNLPALLIAAVLLILPSLPARGESVTADSILDQEGARQAAMEQLPRGATVTGSRCQEIGVGGMDNTRYRCTVDYQPAGTAPSPVKR